MKIEQDKWKHFYVGIAMGIVFQIFFHWLFPGHFTRDIVLSFLIVVAVSYGFELFSKFTGKGHYEVLDAVAAIIGGILGMGVVIIIQLF